MSNLHHGRRLLCQLGTLGGNDICEYTPGYPLTTLTKMYPQVLGCCIVLVFGLGLGKLWWANRVMEKLEVIDAEKRARRSDIQRCGIDALKNDDIPFGIRAIQRGIEVEGIWISSPSDTPDLSQIASSAGLVNDHLAHAGNRGRTAVTHAGSGPQRNDSSEPATLRADEAVYPVPPATFQMPARTRLRCLAQPHFDSSDLQDAIHIPLRSHLDSYVPSGTKSKLLPERRNRPPMSNTGTSPFVGNIGHPASSERGARQHGLAKVHVNQNNRRPNKDFEILPAETFGPQKGFQNITNGFHNMDEGEEHSKPRRARLRKKPPTSQLR